MADLRALPQRFTTGQAVRDQREAEFRVYQKRRRRLNARGQLAEEISAVKRITETEAVKESRLRSQRLPPPPDEVAGNGR